MAVWPHNNDSVNVWNILQAWRTMTSLMLIDSELRFITKEGEKHCLGRKFDIITEERDRFSWVVPGWPKEQIEAPNSGPALSEGGPLVCSGESIGW